MNRSLEEAALALCRFKCTEEEGFMRRFLVIFFIAFGFVAVPIQSHGQAATPSLRLIQTISLPNVHGRIDHFNVDIRSQRLFISALGNHTLEVVDLKSGKWIRSLSGL
ncbi:MAG: hypothetical protein ACREL1_07850, partial [bacterium]